MLPGSGLSPFLDAAAAVPDVTTLGAMIRRLLSHLVRR